MYDPFDDTDRSFRVLVNEANQHSLWPDFADVPRGWVAVFGPSAKQECLSYVSEQWLNITPIVDRERAAS